MNHSRHHIHLSGHIGEILAEKVAGFMGSWRFIIIQTVVVAVWIIINITVFVLRWDPYPFILLNLLFSTQAAYSAPIILQSQNRQSVKDRKRDDLEAEEVHTLFTINEQQLAILKVVDDVNNRQLEAIRLLHEHITRTT